MNGILADDMGLGKTIQTIAILSYIWETKNQRKDPHLIVAPKSTISNWMKEFARWAPHFKVVNLNPKMEFRSDILKNEMQPGKFDICVTTYDAINICPEIRRYNWNYAVFDEAHKLKNSESQVVTNSR